MIIVFSGTEEGNILIRQLLKKGLSVFASFSSEVGKESIVDILPQNKKLKINNRKLKLEEMLDLIKKNKIKYIIDATHPFAVEVSKNAIDASRLSNIRYIRFERKNIIEKESKNIIYFDSFKSSLEFLEKTRGNVFFTIGVNNIYIFKDIYTDKNRKCYIKILPTIESLHTCYSNGVNTNQIIATYKSWSKEMLKSYISENSIDIIVSKQSGESGGENEKINAAKDTNILLLIIKRPEIFYPEVSNNIEEIIKIILNL